MNSNSFEPLFPDIEIEKALKNTQSSCVYLVRDINTRQRYIYRVFTGSDAVYKQMMELTCPYLPRIYNVIKVEDQVHVLEEFIQGDNLAYLIQDQPLLEEDVKHIALEICNALEQLHSISAVHRDIKPSNVIIRGDDAVLIDFDAARIVNNRTTSDTTILGTIGYAAPEQYGFTQTDARADIYSLGILMNELLTKHHPAQKLADGKFLPTISKCIEVNTSRRYQNIKELTAAINSISDKKEHKKPRTFIPIAAILIIFIALLTLIPAFYEKEEPQNIDAAVPTKETSLPSHTEKPVSSPVKETEEVIVTPSVEPAVSPYPAVIANPQEEKGHITEFYFDLDNDGKNEKYAFGTAYTNLLEEKLILSEKIGLSDGDISSRDTCPAIFACNMDGTYTYSKEMTAHLINQSTNIKNLSNEDDMPYSVLAHPDRLNGMSVMFSLKDEGKWMFEHSALFEDIELSASSITKIYEISPDEQRIISLLCSKTQSLYDGGVIPVKAEPLELQVITDDRIITDFEVNTSDTRFIDAKKTDDGTIMITPYNGGSAKFDVAYNGITTEFSCSVALPPISLVNSSVFPEPIYEDFRMLQNETEFEVMLGENRVTDFDAKTDDPSVCTASRTDDGMLLLTPKSEGTVKLTVSVNDMTAKIYFSTGAVSENSNITYFDDNGEAITFTAAPMDFSFDANGDGIDEDYAFGVCLANSKNERLLTTLNLALNMDKGYTCVPYPCVFEYQKDGTLKKSAAVTALLQEPQTDIRYITKNIDLPQNYATDENIPGSLVIEHTFDKPGVWEYSVKAKLDETELSAGAYAIVDQIDQSSQGDIDLHRALMDIMVDKDSIIPNICGTEYFTVMTNSKKAYNFELSDHTNTICTIEKTADNRISITPKATGCAKFTITCGEETKTFVCKCVYSSISLAGTDNEHSIFHDQPFGPIEKNMHFSVLVNGKPTSDFTVTEGRKNVCSIKKTFDGKLLISPINSGTTIFYISTDSGSAVFQIRIDTQ